MTFGIFNRPFMGNWYLHREKMANRFLSPVYGPEISDFGGLRLHEVHYHALLCGGICNQPRNAGEVPHKARKISNFWEQLSMIRRGGSSGGDAHRVSTLLIEKSYVPRLLASSAFSFSKNLGT